MKKLWDVEVVVRSYLWDTATATIWAETKEEAVEKAKDGDWEEIDYTGMDDCEYLDHEMHSERYGTGVYVDGKWVANPVDLTDDVTECCDMYDNPIVEDD
jgi:hypothetical protein